MLRKVGLGAVTLLILSACSAENYYVETKNGMDIYSFDIQSYDRGSYNHFVKFYGNNICPQGYKVVDSKLLRQGIGPGAAQHYCIHIACPQRA